MNLTNCSAPGSLALFWLRPEILSAQCDWYLQVPAGVTAFHPLAYLRTFALTCLLEAPFYFYLLRQERWASRLLALLSGNLLTHPIVYFLLPYLFARAGQTFAVYLTVAETFAAVAEMIWIHLLWRTGRVRTCVLILSANLFSWWIGSAL